MPAPDALTQDRTPPAGRIERFAWRATGLAETWMPDAFVFALAATLLVVLGALAVDGEVRTDPAALVRAWGKGFWALVPFTLQMAMIIVGGYVLATAPPVFRLLRRIASLPKTPRAAVVTVALAAMLSSWLNWGFSLIFSAVLAREVARRMPRADYRALAACSFLGLGTIWAQGLSGSAALQMASADSMPEALKKAAGGQTIPLTDTIFLWQSFACVAIEVVVVAALAWAFTPGPGRSRSAADLGIDLGPDEPPPLPAPRVPGERVEHSPLLLLPVVALGFAYLALHFRDKAAAGGGVAGMLAAIDFNTINLFFLMTGALLHGTPASLMRAVRDATPAVWGVLLQFPFYAGIFGVMTGTALSETIAGVFVGASDRVFYPAMIALYSAVLGVFVPSGGSKWVIEAPYVLDAARTLGVDLGWMVVTYDLGEAVANLVQPFWMLPILALLGLKARDIMGYTFLVAVVVLPLVIALVTLFGLTL